MKKVQVKDKRIQRRTQRLTGLYTYMIQTESSFGSNSEDRKQTSS